MGVMISDGDAGMKIWISKQWPLLIIILLSIGAAIFIWYSTPYGVGVDYDSLFYLDAAQNLNQGHGIYWTGSGGELKPLTHYPPGYPVVLSIPMLVGMDKVQSAQLIASTLLGINVFLIGSLLYHVSGSMIASLLGMVVTCTSEVILRLHLLVLSEPLFFTWMLLSLYLIVKYLGTGKRHWFFFTAAAIAAAALTRYIGTALLITTTLGLFLLCRGTFKMRFGEASRIFVIAIAPSILWMFRNWLLTGAATNRTFQVHPVDIDTFRNLLDVLFDWFTPEYLSHWIEGALLIVLFSGALAYLSWRIWVKHERDNQALLLAFLFLLFSGIYFVQLIVSLSFFDASTRIDDRILSPLFISIWMLTILLTQAGKRDRVRIGFAIGLFLLVFIGLLPKNWERIWSISQESRTVGYGFSARYWQESDMIEWVRSKPNETIIITNQAMAVRYLTDRATIQVPERWDPVKDVERETYPSEINEILSLLKRPNSFLILFKRKDFSQPEDRDWLEGLHVVYESGEGEIFAWDSTIE
jgi:hypothetical protein